MLSKTGKLYQHTVFLFSDSAWLKIVTFVSNFFYYIDIIVNSIISFIMVFYNVYLRFSFFFRNTRLKKFIKSFNKNSSIPFYFFIGLFSLSVLIYLIIVGIYLYINSLPPEDTYEDLCRRADLLNFKIFKYANLKSYTASKLFDLTKFHQASMLKLKRCIDMKPEHYDLLLDKALAYSNTVKEKITELPPLLVEEIRAEKLANYKQAKLEAYNKKIFIKRLKQDTRLSKPVVVDIINLEEVLKKSIAVYVKKPKVANVASPAAAEFSHLILPAPLENIIQHTVKAKNIECQARIDSLVRNNRELGELIIRKRLKAVK
jgi:hypothetical protein